MLQKMTWWIWQFFTRALSLKIGTLMTFFCGKLKMHELKTHRGVMSWQWRMKQDLRRNWLVSSKLTWGIWQILTQTLENFKNLHFNELLLTKAYNVWVKKKYRGVMFDGTEYWCKIWRKSDLCFKNNMSNLTNFHHSTFKSLKIGTLMWSFYPK